MPQKIERREFLKLMGVAPLALKFNRLEKIVLNTIDTADAQFLPVYETHDSGFSEAQILAYNPDYLFLENAKTVDRALTETPYNMFVVDGVSYHHLTGEEKITGKYIPDSIANMLDVSGGAIAIEGIEVPNSLDIFSKVFNWASTGFAFGMLFREFGMVVKRGLIDKKPLYKNMYSRIGVLALLNAWAVGDEFGKATQGAFLYDPTTPEARKAQELSARINSITSFTHPEDMQVFLRNIFASLKLMLLAETNPRGINVPKIAFRFGANHSAITDMIKMGREHVTSFLAIYPDFILRDVIKGNVTIYPEPDKQIDAFCSMVYVPVTEVRRNNNYKLVIKDTRLADYLKMRLL